jgi:AraC-like DNA-binding protein
MYSWVYTILCGLLLFNGISLISRKVAVNFKFLGVFYILFAYQMFITHFRVAGTMYLLPHFFKTGSLVGYLYGPIFYFFLKATIQADFKLRIKNLIHFIPFLLHFFELLPFFMLSAEEKSIIYLKNPQTYFMDVDMGYFSQRTHTILKCILIIAYTIFGYFKISPFLKSIIQSEVPQNRIFGLFLKWSTRLLLISAVLILITYSLYWLFPLNFQLLGHYTFFVSAVFGALFLMLFPEITGWSILSFAKERAKELSEINFGQPKKLDDLSAKIYESFTKVMEENFTNPDLDVGKMAQLLFMSERTLYRKIKEIWGISPNEVLLDFRLKKAYEAIENDPGELLGNIIKQTGFMTNSYFSRCFKKKYGILPSDFQRECRLKNSEIKS